jgi:hypothetical protein
MRTPDQETAMTNAGLTLGRKPRLGFMVLATALLVDCASGPPAADWQLQAKAATDRATTAYLTGDTRRESREFEQARNAISATGRADLLARIELMRCAAHVASLDFEPCRGFEALRADAPAPEIAYADYLAGRPPSSPDLLPAAQREAAAAGKGGLSAADLRRIGDPLARLVAAAVLFETGRSSPPVYELAAETAASQGWRRPLLAWLKVQLREAELSGHDVDAARLRRRIALATGLAG